MIATIIDGVIILLLMGSIGYGYMVSRRVRALTAMLKDLEPLVEEFSSAVNKSENSVSQMRESIDAVERSARAEAKFVQAEEANSAAAFASRRAAAPTPDVPGLRVMRDKKDLVRKFFETTATVEV